MVDYIRAGYRTKMRFWGVSGPLVDVRWYRAGKAAKPIDLATKYYSRKTWRRTSKIAGVGEQEPQVTTYDKGANSLGYRGKGHCGKDAAWSTGGEVGKDAPLALDADGWSICCGPRTYPLGAMVLSGDPYYRGNVPQLVASSQDSGAALYYHANPPGMVTNYLIACVALEPGAPGGPSTVLPDSNPTLVGGLAGGGGSRGGLTYYPGSYPAHWVITPSSGLTYSLLAAYGYPGSGLNWSYGPTVSGGATVVIDLPNQGQAEYLIVVAYVTSGTVPVPLLSAEWAKDAEYLLPGGGVIGYQSRAWREGQGGPAPVTLLSGALGCRAVAITAW